MSAKLDRIGADLEKARKKRAEWDARVKDLERRYREEIATIYFCKFHTLF